MKIHWACLSVVVLVGCGNRLSPLPPSNFVPTAPMAPQGYGLAPQQALTPVQVPAKGPAPTAKKGTTAPPVGAKKPTVGSPTKPAASTKAVPVSTESLKAILQGMRQTWEGGQALKATSSVWETTGSTEFRQVADAIIAKPNRVYGKVLQTSDGKNIGTQAVWLGGDSVKVRTSIFGIMATVSLAMSDDRLKSPRGWTMAQTSMPRMLAAFLAPGAPVTLVGKAQMGDRQVDLIELRTTNLVPGITKERLAMDPQLKLPVMREMYAGEQVVCRNQFSKMEMDPPQAATAFNL